MKKLYITLIILSSLYWLTFKYKNEKLECESKSSIGSTIQVKAVPSAPGLLGMISSSNQFYRCEYYISEDHQLISCQIYSGDSYIANKVSVNWLNRSEAVVIFDGQPTLRCENGWWTKY